MVFTPTTSCLTCVCVFCLRACCYTCAHISRCFYDEAFQLLLELSEVRGPCLLPASRNSVQKWLVSLFDRLGNVARSFVSVLFHCGDLLFCRGLFRMFFVFVFVLFPFAVRSSALCFFVAKYKLPQTNKLEKQGNF